MKIERTILRGVLLSLGICAAAVCWTRGDDKLWRTDFKAAQEEAAKDKKTLLVNFTGSDWCHFCIQLRKEVFDTPEFEKAAPAKFVCVFLDFPREKKLSEELTTQNKDLSKQYNVHGFPTILLLSPDGKVKARASGYRPGGPEKYIKHLDELLEAFDKLAPLEEKLAKAKGLDRAKTLDQLIAVNDKLGNEMKDLDDWQKEIIELDKDNKAGLKSKYEFRAAMAKYNELRRGRKMEEAKEVLADALKIPGIGGEQRQEVYMAQVNEVFAAEGPAKAEALMKKALKEAPESDRAEMIESSIKRIGELVAAEEAVQKAEGELKKAEGKERLELLDRALAAYAKVGNRVGGKDRSADAMALMREAVELDKDGKAGLRDKYEFKVLYLEAASQWRKDPEKALAVLDKALKLPKVSDLEIQQATMLKSNCLMVQQKLDEAIAALETGLKDAPKGPMANYLKQMLTQLKKRVEEKKAKEAEEKAKDNDKAKDEKEPSKKDSK